jgi:enoyl-CoA hydratase
MKSYETLLTELSDGILLVTLNREDKLNALNKTVIYELNQLMDVVYNNTDIKGVIITGSGAKAFAAGADIGEFKDMSEAEGAALSRHGHDTFHKISWCPKPMIAAVNGFALGGGCELAMACHMRLASETAKFGQPEVNLGLIPGYGGTQRMVQLIGKGKAMELLMTADIIDATTAHTLGLVNHVVPAAELIERSRAIITKIASKAPFAIAQVVQCVDAYFTDGVDGFKTETALFTRCVTTHDFKEGTTAFLEKRKPHFIGR